LGYTFTNYSQEQSLGISGVTAGATLGALPSSSTGVPLSWTNMHQARVGADLGMITEWPIRLGFVWTSQVTAAANALPILASPGNGYTAVVGTGHSFTPNFSLDGAFEYSWDSGSVTAANNPAATTAIGNYTANATVVHLSGSYVF
jgi:long-subunit fatty acid transport protein